MTARDELPTQALELARDELTAVLAAHVYCGERYCCTLDGPSRLSMCGDCRDAIAVAANALLASPALAHLGGTNAHD